MNATKPRLIESERTAPFFRALQEKKLLLQYCPSCMKFELTDFMSCPRCLKKLEWREATGEGTLFSWTINYQVTHPSFSDDVPYLICAVKLAESPVLLARTIGLTPEELYLGMPLKICFREQDTILIPFFCPVGETAK